MDVIIMFIMAIRGFFLKVYNFPSGPLVLGLLLGGMIEKNMRTALIISQGDWNYFVSRPISLVLLILIAASFLYPVAQTMKSKKKKEEAPAQ